VTRPHFGTAAIFPKFFNIIRSGGWFGHWSGAKGADRKENTVDDTKRRLTATTQCRYRKRVALGFSLKRKFVVATEIRNWRWMAAFPSMWHRQTDIVQRDLHEK
jgi:hypothetical protein